MTERDVISYEEAERRYLAGDEQPTPERGQFWYLLGRKSPILVALYVEPYIYTADVSNKTPIEVSGPELGRILFGVHETEGEDGAKKFVNNVMFYAFPK